MAEETADPRELRVIKRDLDAVRGQFESGNALMPADRQLVWEAWREATQFVWQRLVDIWTEGENALREILEEGRRQLESGNTNAARHAASRFFEALRTREGRQTVISELKSEASVLRNEAVQREERRVAERTASQQSQYVHPLEAWKAELERSRMGAARIGGDVDTLERQVREAGSILEQAMLRGTLVEKKRKLSEVERTIRSLEQRIDQAEGSSVITAG